MDQGVATTVFLNSLDDSISLFDGNLINFETNEEGDENGESEEMWFPGVAALHSVGQHQPLPTDCK